MKKLKIILHLIIAVLFILELVSRWNGNHNLEYLVKPWLLVWIGAYFFVFAKKRDLVPLALLAFLFSWAGDMFLMVAHTSEMLFFAGVGGFFVAQLFYIVLFLKSGRESGEKGFIARYPLWALPFVAYLVSILWLLVGNMQGIMIPVIVIYAFSLIGMSIAAFNRKGRVSPESFRLLFAGSLFFVVSDSMIAINKFYAEFNRSSFLVMLTYFIAQYLIMRGLLAESGEKE
ncbi:MAG: lysoplasmalogenase [Bacteroidales bacterium]